jgi:sugar lactone lactonase YvrE
MKPRTPPGLHLRAIFTLLVLAASTPALAATSRTYTLDADFDLGTLNSVNHTEFHDQLQLNKSSQSDPFAYIAQPVEGTLLKIDTSTGKQVGRYFSVHLASCPTCPTENNAGCGPWSGNWSPSRTAVDFDGNVWVANRGFGSCGAPAVANDGQGSVTKIGNTTAGTCVDRNENGVIDTSRDANNDGMVDRNDPAEFLGQDDECLVNSIAVGTRGAVLRAITLDQNGFLWVGGYNSQQAYRVDPNTGATTHTIALATTPYGFVIRGNHLYSASLGNRVVRVDISNLAAPVLNHKHACGNYGITVDTSGVGWFSGCGGLQRCDFDSAAPDCTAHGGGFGSGLTVDGDGHIWLAGDGRLYKFSSAGVLLGSVPVPGAPYGVAVASDNRLFSAGQSEAATVNPGAVNGPPGTVHQSIGIGYPGNSAPFAYTYSDMTGFIARNITAPQGTWTVQEDSGGAGTIWTRISWNGEPQGAVPAGTLIKVEARAAETAAGLGAEAYVEVTSGADLAGALIGRHIEVRATLRNNTPQVVQTPVLSDLTIEGRSPNTPPVAQCADRSVCTSDGLCTGVADVNNGSFDPDGDLLTLVYNPASPYPLGVTTVALSVSDGKETASCSASATVNDCQPPAISCPPVQTVECSNGGGSATIAATATDNCGAATATCTPSSGTFPVGTTPVTCVASDGAGNSSNCASSVAVVDTTPPVVGGRLTVDALWAPNHKYRGVSLADCGIEVTDACGGNLGLPSSAEITCVTSDELDNTGGDGDATQDIVVTSATTVNLRAERDGRADGRVYRIGFRVRDAAGNPTEGTCVVTVPHDQSPPVAAVDSGVAQTVCR